ATLSRRVVDEISYHRQGSPRSHRDIPVYQAEEEIARRLLCTGRLRNLALGRKKCQNVSHRRTSRHLNRRQQLGDDVTDVRVWTRKHRLDGGPPGSHGHRKGGKMGQKTGTPDWRGALGLGHIFEPDQSGPCLACPVIQRAGLWFSDRTMRDTVSPSVRHEPPPTIVRHSVLALNGTRFRRVIHRWIAVRTRPRLANIWDANTNALG